MGDSSTILNGEARERPTGRPRAILSVLAAAALWGTIGPSYEVLLDRVEVDPVTLVTIRAATATALLCGWLAMTDRSAFRIRRADFPTFLVLGLIAVTVFYVALIYAYDLTSVAVGTVLLYLAPALVTVGATLFLGEALTGRKLLALVLSFAGCALVVEAYRPANLRGDVLGVALGLVSAVTYAAYSLIGKPLLTRYRAVTVLSYYLALGTMGLVVVKLATSPTVWPPPSGIVAVAGYNGVVTTLVPIVLYTLGLQVLPSSEASILATAEPVVAIVIAAVFLSEALGMGQWLGAGFVLGGVLLLAARGPTGGRDEAPADRSATGSATVTALDR